MENTEISIKINLADRYYPLRIPASEEAVVRASAKRINEKAKYYHESFSVQDKQDSIAMAALDIISDLMNEQKAKSANSSEMESKLDSIQLLLQSVSK